VEVAASSYVETKYCWWQVAAAAQARMAVTSAAMLLSLKLERATVTVQAKEEQMAMVEPQSEALVAVVELATPATVQPPRTTAT
jgi:hypothetical protein